MAYTPPQNIYEQIRNEAKDFYEQFIEVVPGYAFNQYRTIRRANLYLNSKYENGGQMLGRDLLFYNVVSAPCEVATKMLNIDTKNIRLWPMNPKSYFSTWLLEKELKLWLKTSKMGKILNQLAEEAPKLGSVVLEKTKDGAEMVDLRRLINDQTVDNIQDSRFITTIHYMTPTQLRETGWDNVEEAITRFSDPDTMLAYEDEYGNLNQMQSTPYIKVYKRYGEVPEHFLKGGTSDKLVKSLFITAGADYLYRNVQGQPIGEQGLTLFSSRWYKKWPFKDFHYKKIPGRWLGLGIVEMLFDVQVRMNELKNSRRFNMEISGITIFQTKSKTAVRNILTDLQPGDLLQGMAEPIEAVPNEDRNLRAYNDEEQSYTTQADRLSFAYEAVRGEPLPASTPATNAVIATQGATSVYAFKRENLALFLQDYFNDLVLPQLMRDLTPEHIMRFVGNAQELQKLDEAAAELFVNDFVKQAVLNGNAKVLDPIYLDKVKENAINQYKNLGESRFLKIKKAFYSDAEFEFDFIVGNEQADPATIAANTQAILAVVGANPALLDDPRLKVLVFKYAESLGVSPAEMELADQQAAQKAQQQPQMLPGAPAPAPTQPPGRMALAANT